VLRAHIDRCLQSRVHNLQKGIARRRHSQLRSPYDDFEEMVMAMVRIGEYAQTMCKPAMVVDFADETARSIAIWQETVDVADLAVMVR
jgi:hypothetical protein